MLGTLLPARCTHRSRRSVFGHRSGWVVTLGLLCLMCMSTLGSVKAQALTEYALITYIEAPPGLPLDLRTRYVPTGRGMAAIECEQSLTLTTVYALDGTMLHQQEIRGVSSKIDVPRNDPPVAGEMARLVEIVGFHPVKCRPTSQAYLDGIPQGRNGRSPSNVNRPGGALSVEGPLPGDTAQLVQIADLRSPGCNGIGALSRSSIIVRDQNNEIIAELSGDQGQTVTIGGRFLVAVNRLASEALGTREGITLISSGPCRPSVIGARSRFVATVEWTNWSNV